MFAYTKDNEIIHIKDALPKTDYYCGHCGGRLRVRNGKIKIKHFYHLDNDCGDRGESLIHKYWKEYFSKLKEFEEFKIIDSRTEVRLLNNTYIPDIVLKIDNENYIIVEICYKNPKTFSYLEKFKKLTKLKKVYEIKVDFDEIIETKEIYDREKYINEYNNLKNKLFLAKEFILNISQKGGLKFEINHHYPYLSPVLDKYLKMEYRWNYNPITGNGYSYPYKPSIIPTKSKIFLSISSRSYDFKIKTKPFLVNIYNKKEAMETYKFGELFIENSEFNLCISVIILE